MARAEIIIDDLDGTEIKQGKGGPVSFAFDGADYVIDLTDKNKATLAKALQPFIDKAQKVSRLPRSRRGTAAPKDNPKEIREWAKQNGFPDLPSRGRIPANVMEAWNSK